MTVDHEPLEPQESPGLLLWRVTLRWKREIVAALAPLELTHAQFVLLASSWWLGRNGEHAPTQRAVAEQAGTDPMMTSQVLRALERRGLLTREPDPTDARSRRVVVTAAGAELAPRAIGVVEAVDHGFFSGARTDELLHTLRRLDAPR
ncbi:MAG: MarR family winged helix-turn-helix transcriptional regulator [Patulibacter minatonensis]